MSSSSSSSVKYGRNLVVVPTDQATMLGETLAVNVCGRAAVHQIFHAGGGLSLLSSLSACTTAASIVDLLVLLLLRWPFACLVSDNVPDRVDCWCRLLVALGGGVGPV